MVNWSLPSDDGEAGKCIFNKMRKGRMSCGEQPAACHSKGVNGNTELENLYMVEGSWIMAGVAGDVWRGGTWIWRSLKVHY